MPQKEDHVSALVRDVVLSELSLVVAQPQEVISLDDHLVHVIHADANDLSFDLIPFVQNALGVRIPGTEWSEACTVGQVCALLASHYRQKPASERAAIEARKTRRALRSGPLFKPGWKPAPSTVSEKFDPVFALVRDVVFWTLEGLLERPRSSMSLDDDVTEAPYANSNAFNDGFIPDVEHLLEVSVSRREWSNARTIGGVCDILVRHYEAKPAHERQALDAELRAAAFDQYNAPLPRKWWQVWRWELPRWPA